MVKSVKIIGHRGYPKKYPENTLLSFKQAREHGADAIELDVHFTKDGELVVHHDYSLEDTSNVKRLIADLDSKYIQSFIVEKNGFKESTPLLKEVFEANGDRVGYEIEMKGFTSKFIEAVIKLSRDCNLLELIEFTSPHPYLLSYLKTNYPNIKVGMFVSSFPSWMSSVLGQKITLANAILGNINVLHCPESVLTADFVRKLHNNNILVHAAECNDEHQILNAFKLDVDQLSTDDVELACRLKDRYYQKQAI